MNHTSSLPAERRVLVVDDDASIVELVRPFLRDAGFRMSHAASGEAGLAAVVAEQPDIVLLELRLPDVSGLEVMRCIRIASDVPIIIVTARGEEIDRVVGLELGADDYVRKPFFVRELVARVHAVLRRSSRTLAPSTRHDVLRFGSIEIDRTAHCVRRNRAPVDVTPIEFRVLNALAENIDRVMTRSQIIECASPDGQGGDRTLDRHVSNLRQKIEEAPARPRFILTVARVGYKLVDPVEPPAAGGRAPTTLLR